MNRRGFLLGLVASLVVASAAEARVHVGPSMMKGHRVQSSAGMLDGGSVATMPNPAYSFRKLRQAYTGNSIRFRRGSDNVEQDFGFVRGQFATPAAEKFCDLTTCYFVKWYDQGGGTAGDAATSTVADQSRIIFNCTPQGFPCIEMNRWQNLSTIAGNMTPTAPVTMSAVARGVSGSIACNTSYQYNNGTNFNRMFIQAGSWVGSGNNATFIAGPAVNELLWHAGLTIINGASSLMRTDAAEVAGSLTLGTPAGPYFPFYGADNGVCYTVENLLWNGYGLTPTERTTVTANQKSFWGF